MPARKSHDDLVQYLTAAERKRWIAINERLETARAEARRLSAARRQMMWRMHRRARARGV